MRTLGASHAGRIRPNNQDAFVCGMLTEKTAFAVVCDGMGGANGGNIASGIAVRIIADRLIDGYREHAEPTALQTLLEDAVLEANTEVFEAAMENEELRGMGTTMVAAIVSEQQAFVCHVGDSRAYVIAGHSIEQITHDHSVVQEMVQQGRITAEQARSHPQKHLLTRAIGVESQVESEFSVHDFPSDGVLLLCTDGLTNMVETDMLQSLVRTFSVEEIPNKLINTANLAGGSDNITVVVIAGNERM
ncbi:MAG: Stp1/IreP family PP2C-type Ser/Thr phosphatase [Clostridia bacterium]|nr:Stp1/IreP family PP2C-type Ser/Thr phosphatase [Clostridia bacterium]